MCAAAIKLEGIKTRVCQLAGNETEDDENEGDAAAEGAPRPRVRHTASDDDVQISSDDEPLPAGIAPEPQVRADDGELTV